MSIASIERFNENAMLGLWLINETPEALLATLKLTSAERNTYETLRTDKRKKEWLACRNLLNEMIGQATEILKDADGKPFLVNSPYFISMSHSGDYACVYLSKNKNIGVDIQKFKPSISKGVDFFLHEDELKWIDIQDNALLHLVWSVKETAFKFAGDKNVDFRNDISLHPFLRNQNGAIEVSIISNKKLLKTSVAFSFFEDYVLTRTV